MKKARKLCYDGHGGDGIHFESPGPTCFELHASSFSYR